MRYFLAFLWLGQIASAWRKSLMAAESWPWLAQLEGVMLKLMKKVKYHMK